MEARLQHSLVIIFSASAEAFLENLERGVLTARVDSFGRGDASVGEGAP